MKQVIDNLYYSAINDLNAMRKSNMTLCERLKYERALIKLDAMKQILNKYNLIA